MHRFNTTIVKHSASRLWLLVALLWSASSHSVVDNTLIEGKTASEWIQAMVDSAQTTPYKGTFSFHQTGMPLSSFGVMRGQLDNMPFERLRHLTEPMRAMVRHGEMITFTARKGDDFIKKAGSFVPTFFDGGFTKLFSNLPVHYDAVFAGRKQIAERAALGIHVVPKDKHRYGYRMWVDIDSALMLGFEMLDTNKQGLEAFIFKTFELIDTVTVEANHEPIQHDQISMRIRPRKRSLTPLSVSGTEYKNWCFDWLPEGFALISRRSKTTVMPGITTELHSLVYSDGLAVFSIFIEKLPGVQAHAKVEHQGGTTTTVRWAKDDANISHIVALVGEIPESTALRIAKAIRYNTSGQRHPAKTGNTTRPNNY